MAHNQRRCEMKSYHELKAEMEAIQQEMVETKENEHANGLRRCSEFGFTAWGMLKDPFARGRGEK